MSMEDLTIKQVNDATSAMLAMSTTAIEHTLEHINEPDHDCDFNVEDLDDIDIPSFDDWDLQVMLSFEDSMVAQFKFLRSVLISQGYDISEEVTT
jgi:hypothetical protein